MDKLLEKFLPLYLERFLQQFIERIQPLLLSEKLLPLTEVLNRVGFGSSYVYELIKIGEFPAPVKIGNASRWRESEVQEWIAKQIEKGAIPPFDRKPSETSVFFGIRGFCGQIGGNWSHEKEASSARIRGFESQHKYVFGKGRLNA